MDETNATADEDRMGVFAYDEVNDRIITFVALFVIDFGSNGDTDLDVLSRSPFLVAGPTVLAAIGFDLASMPKVEEGAESFVDDGVLVAVENRRTLLDSRHRRESKADRGHDDGTGDNKAASRPHT